MTSTFGFISAFTLSPLAWLPDPCQLVGGPDEVVRTSGVFRMLECRREGVRLGVDAQARRLADPVRERDIEHLYV